ncbi:MAG: TolC family protein [Planctomycetota bacterium]
MKRELFWLGVLTAVGCSATPSRHQELLRRQFASDEPTQVAATESPDIEGERMNIPAAFQTLQDADSSGGNGDVGLAIHLRNSADELALPSTQAGMERAELRSVVETPLATSEDIRDEIQDESIPIVELDTVEMNLPSVLAAVGGNHPAVSAARWRVRRAYAELEAANVLWLPFIQTGFGFHRHDGNYQASNGDIVDVNRNSFQYGLGGGATGAGTTQQPGLIAQFRLADAIFEPRVTERRAWAQGHAASAALNEQLLEAAASYTELVTAVQLAAVMESSQDRTAALAKLTSDFAEAGEGLQADADRLQTEVSLVESRLIQARGRIELASARLSQAIGMRSASQIVPMEINLLPITWQDSRDDRGTLIATGLSMRPELKEAQALVAEACEAYKREHYAPFVPSVLLGFSTGGFGGGLGNDLDQIDDRYDFDAIVSWRFRNLGVGERAIRRERSARVQEAKFEKIRRMDQVAREITESHATVAIRSRQIDVTQAAATSAQSSFERNLKRIREGEGLPLEVLQSVQALELAETAYVDAVAGHNLAQLRLQWALGWPIQGAPPE